jgi:hypothetical protein
MRAVPELGVAITILSFVTAQRLVELVYARRNKVRNYAIVTAEIWHRVHPGQYRHSCHSHSGGKASVGKRGCAVDRAEP